MNKQVFLTDIFYEDYSNLLMVFNKILKEKIVYQKDNYASGEFLSLDIKDTLENRKLLRHLISDFEEYKNSNAELFVIDNQKDILDLTGLQYYHAEFFPYEDHIRFNKNIGDYGMYITNEEVV